jgi:type I restriction enzyme S subunit
MVKQEKTKLPNSWKWVKLGEICELSSLKHTPDKEEILFYIGLEHIEKNTGRLLEHVGKEKIDTVKNKFEKGDLLYGKLRPYLNKVYLANQSGVCSTDILVFKLLDTCYGQYLYYLMLSRAFVNEMSNNTSGVNLPRVSTKFILNYPIALPSISIQQEIVSKIEELFSELDKGIENLRIAQQQLKTYRQSVLKWAFEGKLTNENVKQGELPNGWKWVPFNEIFDVFVGSTPSRKVAEYWDGKINWISSGEVHFNTINETKEKISQQGLDRSSCKVHPKGTVILAMIGEGKTRGQAAILNTDATHNQNTAAIRVEKSNTNSYLLYYFLVYSYENTRKIGSGNNQKALNKKIIEKILFPLSPINEQYKIVQEIERRLSVADKIEESITQSLQQAEALRQSILKKAFEGKLI